MPEQMSSENDKVGTEAMAIIRWMAEQSRHTYDVHMEAFNTLDDKAGGAIGYVTVAASLVGGTGLWLADPNPSTRFWIIAALTFFACAIIVSLWLRSPMQISAPPRGDEMIDYVKETHAEWPDAGFRGFAAATEEAGREIQAACELKSHCLTIMHTSIAGGLMCLILALVLR